MNEVKEIQTLIAVKKLRVDSLFGKRKHYAASNRKSKYHNRLGISAIVLNIFVGSILFGYLCEAIPNTFKWVGAIMALGSATLAAIQTFFNFDKMVEGHSRIASSYLEIAKECIRVIGYYEDNIIDKVILKDELEKLALKYNKAVADAVAFPTENRDYIRAKENFAQEEGYTDAELKIGGV
jgi:hypothetical protein